jgi:hypothetical protein
MQLEIASRAYQFELVPGPLRKGRQRCATLCDMKRQRILVSSAVPPEVRLEVAVLAVTEAWNREVIQRPPLRFVGNVS